MIVIKNTELSCVIAAINTDRSYIAGLKETIAMIMATDAEVKEKMQTYIKHNAVLNGIVSYINKSVTTKHDLFQTMDYCLDNAVYLLDEIETRLKKSKKTIFDTNAITYREKGMFDWLSSISFYINYTSKILDIVLTQPKNVGGYLPRIDLEFVNKTVGFYNTVTKRLADARKTLVRSIDALGDEQYDPEYSSMIEDIKGKEATSIGLLPHHINPDYWRRYVIMRLDVRKIKANQETIDMYASKLQRLENQRNGVENPSLEAQIREWENEIQILDAEIRDIEEKYAQ